MICQVFNFWLTGDIRHHIDPWNYHRFCLYLSSQGGSLARRSVVAELSNNASISGATSNANNDDDDDDFDYEPAKSKRRVSSASTERGTSPSSGAEVYNLLDESVCVAIDWCWLCSNTTSFNCVIETLMVKWPLDLSPDFSFSFRHHRNTFSFAKRAYHNQQHTPKEIPFLLRTLRKSQSEHRD